jgi:hypothetical protein
MHMRRRQIRNPDETVISFLARELPPARRDDAEHFAKAIKDAGERYDLCSLDILTRDDLASRIGPERIDCLVGLLDLLKQRADALERKLQKRGKPRDLASERWILEMADIFENAFSKRPTVSGSGEDSARRRGRFYRLLVLGRPLRYARHGRLTLKHIQKLLKLRSQKPIEVAEFLRASAVAK